MSQVFRLRYRPIYAAGLAIALTSLGIYLYPVLLAGQAPPGTDRHPIRELQEERLAILRQIVDLVDQKRRQGNASMAELALANRDVAEAELEICANQAERVIILEKIVEDARMFKSKAAQLAQDNVASQEFALAMKADWLKSRIRLELARAEVSNELNCRGQTQVQRGYAPAPAK
jgi:hypothetical protein